MPQPLHKLRAFLILPTVLTLAGLGVWLINSPSSASSGTPSFTAATNITVGTNPQSVAVGDFNGDSKLDLAVANSGSGNVSILLDNGSGSFNPLSPVVVGGTPVSVTVGDFNKDGNADLAVANFGSAQDQGSILIMFGDGAGGFTLGNSLVAGTH